jgi:predicted house-cleaning NTP pyrophosphatase (Maf/HAM1 superfamily)
MIRYVLASASPRRLELMEQLGIYFEVSPAHGEEKTTKELPEDIVEELSCAKNVSSTQDTLIGQFKDKTGMRTNTKMTLLS